MGSAGDGGLHRIVDVTGVPEIVDVLAALPGADFTSLMLHVARERAAKATPASVLRQYSGDRFVSRGPVSFAQIRAAEDLLLRWLPTTFEVLMLSPLAPFGAHSALAPVDQHKVVSTMRASEVAADPTNVLAIEASIRRKAHARSNELVSLAATQRIVRAQFVDGPNLFAHFQLFGLVSAGRDRGDLAFERESAVEHLRYHVDVLVAAGAESVRVELTDFTAARFLPVVDAIRSAFSLHRRVEVVDRPDRTGGRGYYLGFCFKTHAAVGGEVREIGDGGFVDWTQRLAGSKKERCLISGIGVERLATARDA